MNEKNFHVKLMFVHPIATTIAKICQKRISLEEICTLLIYHDLINQLHNTNLHGLKQNSK